MGFIVHGIVGLCDAKFEDGKFILTPWGEIAQEDIEHLKKASKVGYSLELYVRG